VLVRVCIFALYASESLQMQQWGKLENLLHSSYCWHAYTRLDGEGLINFTLFLTAPYSYAHLISLKVENHW